MSKIWLIIQREYITRVRRKAFIITTLLAPLGFAVFIGVLVLLGTQSTEKTKILVIDNFGEFTELKDSPLLYFDETSGDFEAIQEDLSDEYAGILVIPENMDIYNPQITYWYQKQPGIRTKEKIRKVLQQRIEKLRRNELNIEKGQFDKITEQVRFQEKSLYGETEKANTELSTGIGYFTGMLIYIILLVYGTMVMRGVMEEKTNRIAEVIISSVKPFQLMFGKIFGIALVGLTQFILWAVLIISINIILGVWLGNFMTGMEGMPGQDPAEMSKAMERSQVIFEQLSRFDFAGAFIVFTLYFLGGYFLYASLFAAIGSVVNDENDTQSLTFPVMLPIIISVFIMMRAVEQPQGYLAFWGSIIPFTSPVVMPAMYAFNGFSLNLVLSLVLLLLTVMGAIWMAGKIYRTGILMYGKKITLKEIGKWLFYKG